MVKGPALALTVLALLLSQPEPADAQGLAIAIAGDTVTLRTNDWSFLTGEPLARVKEGRTVRVELTALVLPAPARNAAAAVRRVCSISYDLWEERFAVATAGAAPASVSHLTAAAAETWCLDKLVVPIASLGGVDPQRFWIRLDYRILDGDGAQDSDDSGLTLQRLIDVLSRRRKTDAPARALEGGPFRLR